MPRGLREYSHWLLPRFWPAHCFFYQSAGSPFPPLGLAHLFSPLFQTIVIASCNSSFWFGFLHCLASPCTPGGSLAGGNAEKLNRRANNLCALCLSAVKSFCVFCA